MKLADQLIALLVVFIWGTNFVIIEIGLRELPPFLFACLRFLLVVFPLVFFLPRPKVAWWKTATYGFLIGFGQFGLLFWAIRDNITPGLASLVVQMQVFFTILLATFLFKERVQLLQWLALLVGILGLGVIMVFTDSQTTTIGLFVVIIAAISWAGGNIIVKTAQPKDIIAFIVWSSIFAVPPLFLFSLTFEGSDLIIHSITHAGFISWGAVLWQSIGNTLIGYGFWNLLLKRFSAVDVAPWALLVPVFGMAASALFLNEPMPYWKWIAAILIVSGLMLNIVAINSKSAK